MPQKTFAGVIAFRVFNSTSRFIYISQYFRDISAPCAKTRAAAPNYRKTHYFIISIVIEKKVKKVEYILIILIIIDNITLCYTFQNVSFS